MGLIVGMDEVEALEGDQRFAAYACLDATGTREIYDCLKSTLTEKQAKVYRWTMAQLGPAITMGRRGILVDTAARDKAIATLEKELAATIAKCQKHPFVMEHWDGTQLNTGKCSKREGKHHLWPRNIPDGPERLCTACGSSRILPAPFEPGSNDQTAHLLYDLLQVPTPGGKTGERAVDEDSLDAIRRWAATLKVKLQGLTDLIDLILTVRDCVKQLGTLRTPLSATSRFHATFRPFGAWTSRWSSKRDPFELGQNAQNIGEQHRHIFVADPGKRMGYSDLKTAESLVFGYLAGDEDYIDAHKGDVHTKMTRLLWPGELPWTGNDKKDKEIAKSHYPKWDNVEGHDYRFQAKRIVHGSSYGQSPHGISRLMHIPLAVAKAAQGAFFGAFPRLMAYQKYIYASVVEGLPIATPFGREIILMGRPWDEHTYKQGLALTPQSTVGDVLNTALFRVWSKHDPDLVQLLAQIHDAILAQWEEKKEDQAICAIADCMKVTLPITDIYGVTRSCQVGFEIAVGYNWGKKSKSNPRGLEEISV